MSKVAWLYLRHTFDRRFELFSAGLKRHGYRVENGLPTNIGDQDIFITWNRLAASNNIAKQFEARGQTVLVAENASWGNSFQGKKWFHVARNYHNTAGCFPIGDSERWDNLGCELKPFRNSADFPEVVVLPQRGIGSDPTRMPQGWAKRAQKGYGARVRLHPGKNESHVISLAEDLENCGKVVTWGSGAAIKALMLGIPVLGEMPNWIARQDNTEVDRLRMFRELAWAQFAHEEIQSGFVFERLINGET